jgi:hypothetical protein
MRKRPLWNHFEVNECNHDLDEAANDGELSRVGKTAR